MSTKNSIAKACTNCKLEFNIDSGDFSLYEKVGLGIPDECFECRLKHQLGFSVFGKFRKGVSDLSGDSLITVLPENARYPIYKSSEWWGDAWDPMSFGVEYDGNRSFFEQLKELQEKIPRPHQEAQNNLNCEWCNDVWESKNCYLSRHISKCENVSYGYRVVDAKDSFDLVVCFNMQNSYDCLFCFNSFNLNFSENSRDCIDSYFLFDCRNCQNCFMSYNLRNKQYCIRNKEYKKDEYFQEIEKMNLDSFEVISELKKEFQSILKDSAVHRENFNIKTTESTGNYLNDCDKCINCFTWSDSQNCRNSLRGLYSKDCIDQAVTWHTENSGNNSCVDGGYQIKYSACSTAKYSEYLDLCEDVEYCFGCIGLRKKKNCILNKQYDKESYEILKEKIVGDMKKRGEYGKFLPMNMAICDFNFSTGILYLPNTKKEEIIKRGGYWSDDDFTSNEGINTKDIPDSINETGSEIVTQALICPQSNYRFNISQSEYDFHKRKKFALPRLHFDVRMKEQVEKTAVLRSYPYQCIYCQREVMAYYPPEWGYAKIACEDCYKQNIA